MCLSNGNSCISRSQRMLGLALEKKVLPLENNCQELSDNETIHEVSQ